MKKWNFDGLTFLSFSLIVVSVFFALSYAQRASKELENLAEYGFTRDDFPYHIHNPKIQFSLPHSLIEVSGLTVTDNGQFAYVVNDQQGIFYKVDLAQLEIVERKSFALEGDYEGVEIVDDLIIALSSKGFLFVSRLNEDSPAKRIKLNLHKGCDAEGLGYEHSKKRLLVACKKNKKNHHLRLIYSVNLPTFETVKKPAYEISTEELLIFASKQGRKFLNEESLKNFAPSAITVHKKTGDIFILSSKVNLLLRIAADNSIKDMIPLSRKIYEQPEGIAFSNDNHLFITSEGRSRGGMLFGLSPSEGNYGK